jgi:DNA-binding GntR family transcriptional regulator
MITRDLLRDQVERAIVEQILDGQLPSLARINESTLSAELGVSRTPLREALLHLEQEGFIEAQPGRGFRVAPMSGDEVRQLYPIVAALEGLAVRLSQPLPDVDAASELNEAILEHQDDPDQCLALDAQFHALIVANCGNPRLLDLLAAQKRVMQRYERAYMSRTARQDYPARTMASSVEEHREILAALARRDTDAAAHALDVNWEKGMRRLLEILGEPAGA